ncbi:MAG TPA: cytochrome c, partial [Dehalococcoidia bacterium]|nr:cytochrome c [Dehalococcoidia bacterium]
MIADAEKGLGKPKPVWAPTGLIAAGVVLIVLVLGIALVVSFLRRDEPERYAAIDDHFKYGSIGSEARTGVPYWIWLVLPTVFPDLLPDRPGEGYARFGYVYESADAKRPIGTSLREKPIPLVGLNCAVCHTGTVSDADDGSQQIVLGMPAHQFDLQSYARFLFAAGQDPRFNADTLLAAIQAENPSFSPVESLFYRFVVIPRAKDALRERATVFAWWDSRPRQGPGRVD